MDLVFCLYYNNLCVPVGTPQLTLEVMVYIMPNYLIRLRDIEILLSACCHLGQGLRQYQDITEI